ncbi:hypothetical protein CBS63078_374 [Aspergillus niger]|uniref:Contig An11c0150, genomic contig n=4 Tax=Aspergillus niger TaxID=5061 RepID=A2QW08_ASPNC|nr:uncharacterized protein An11g03400 [Aspergillus niger]EHA19523.1 hypothetical protein ASPNIDRAFT_38947 [Aspergillus niger ATCC 1015]RDH21390.1 hypothetical protein M747DRAFT_235408 [Aspergillus niger ATCC 13496]KAI2816995.1 hypothetical protein CBS115989_6292 [Aspergillus niger]KAI2833212.1 hypothetical protein CBS133816_577 [Aspergillus niger]KAI2854388.1 hypothetical protein CBS11232_4978 [Aspergillus niger]|eukprot:XP_001394341.1 hypothetical protein ANI_1_1814094 [Aspergillus niger CBS 513.88]
MGSIAKENVYLPIVVVDEILEYLDLETIKSLRLTDRTWSGLCLGPRFKSFMRHQSTDLTPQSLESLGALSCHAILRPAVKDLTIVAAVYDSSLLQRVLRTSRCEDENGTLWIAARDCTPDEVVQAEADLAWLEEQSSKHQLKQENHIVSTLAAILNNFGRLDWVSMEAKVTHSPRPEVFRSRGDWHAIWLKATQVYHIAMSAIAESTISVNSLTIFRNPIRSAIPSNEITTHMRTLDPAACTFASGQSIKNFSIDLSTRIDTDRERLSKRRGDIEIWELETRRSWHGLSPGTLLASLEPEVNSEDNYPGVARLLQKMPNLEALTLRLRCTVIGDVSLYHRLFEEIASKVHLPQLKRLRLLGIYATSDSLQCFLRKHPDIELLGLEKVNLVSGAWQPVFEEIRKMPSLTRVVLASISGEGRTLNLRPAEDKDDRSDPSNTDYYLCTRGVFVHRREFDARDIQKGFQFNTDNQGAPQGTHGFTSFLVFDQEHYGLP